MFRARNQLILCILLSHYGFNHIKYTQLCYGNVSEAPSSMSPGLMLLGGSCISKMEIVHSRPNVTSAKKCQKQWKTHIFQPNRPHDIKPGFLKHYNFPNHEWHKDEWGNKLLEGVWTRLGTWVLLGWNSEKGITNKIPIQSIHLFSKYREEWNKHITGVVKLDSNWHTGSTIVVFGISQV